MPFSSIVVVRVLFSSIFFCLYVIFTILFVFCVFSSLPLSLAKVKIQIIQIHKQTYRSNLIYCTLAKTIIVYFLWYRCICDNLGRSFYFSVPVLEMHFLRFWITFSAVQCKSNLFICLKKKGQMGKTVRTKNKTVYPT